MLSRVAEQIYWLGRYLERIENTARLILVRHQLVLDLPEHVQPDWTLLTESLGISPSDLKKYRKKISETEIISYLFGDKNNVGSIVNSIICARENVRITRDTLPSEIWEGINSLFLSMTQRRNRELPRSQRHNVLNSMIKSCQTISGTIEGTMNHGQAYQFFHLGQAIERADMSSRIIDAGSYALGGDQDEQRTYSNVIWISILRSLSAYQMYRLTVRSNIRRDSVLEFLFRDKEFPRSVYFCLDKIRSSSNAISKHSEIDQHLKRALRIIDKELTTQENNRELHLIIDQLQMEFCELHKGITREWFDLTNQINKAAG